VIQDIKSRGLIVIGSIKTGKTKILCETLADNEQAQHSHPHVYLSPDNGWAVFNSKKDGIPHVAVARIPDDLWKELNGLDE
jgi:hypothetical protein